MLFRSLPAAFLDIVLSVENLEMDYRTVGDSAKRSTLSSELEVPEDDFSEQQPKQNRDSKFFQISTRRIIINKGALEKTQW